MKYSSTVGNLYPGEKEMSANPQSGKTKREYSMTRSQGSAQDTEDTGDTAVTGDTD